MADLAANGEFRAAMPYAYEKLEQIEGCAEIIGDLSGLVWQSPEGFEADVGIAPRALTLRWTATANTAGLMTLRQGRQVVSITVLASGLNSDADDLTIGTLQQQLVQELHGTEFEASFALTDLRDRPLAATINIFSPTDPAGRSIAAIADRCFAAAYFRYLHLV